MVINNLLRTGEFVFNVPALGVVWFSTDGTGDSAIIGSAEVESDLPIAGTVLFSGEMGVAGVGAVEATSNFMVPIESDLESGIRTGLALANPTAESVDFTLTLRGSDGVQLNGGTVMQSLPTRGQLAQFPDEMFADSGIDFSQFRGSLEVESEAEMIGMAIRLSPGEFATLPVTSIR